MADYRQMFGEKVARGLGLERPLADVERSVQEYQDDPASAFTRLAALMEPPGDLVATSSLLPQQSLGGRIHVSPSPPHPSKE